MVLVVVVALTFGVTLFLASIGAVLRDVGDFIQPAVTLLFFLSPILYPAATIAETAEWVLVVNPVAPMLEAIRDLAFEQTLPDLVVLSRMLASAVGWIFVGTLLYRFVRGALADLI
jgi:ABC-type polysaccharide/polyol phosphate export permease